MRILVVGLGSMGKRRVRNLLAIGGQDIAGFDLREDRREEAHSKYGIRVYESYEVAVSEHRPEVLVISTPPKFHMDYAWGGAKEGMHCFIEASVVDADRILELHEFSEEQGIIMAPSCTMRYTAGVKKVKELVTAGVIGDVLNINYQTGQYLPDWHPWEKVEDFYVSDRDTGGCREIVPFELTWINDVFGEPTPLACVKAQLSDMNADIDDVYHCLMQYPGRVLANITIEVLSRPEATRELRILGSSGEIAMSADEGCVRYCNVEDKEWKRFSIGGGTVETGYINPEEPYIEEMSDFLHAVEKNEQTLFPNTLLDDYKVLQNLYRLEEVAVGNI